MADPAGECPGFSCANYYTGFGAGEDACYFRQDVSAAAASCNGAGACLDPATICPLQPRGPLQVDCNNTCEAPITGSCNGTMPGACRDLDDPAITTSCGTGACQRTVQRCVGGIPQACTAGSPTVERCNNIDDDCDAIVDDGNPADLCSSAPFASGYACTAGTCSFTCITGRYDLNTTYSDGCECADDAYGNACTGPTVLPSLTGAGSASYSGTIAPNGEQDWFSISFPDNGRGPGNGTPRIALTGTNASNFVLNVRRDCANSATCGSGTSSSTSVYEFRDNASSGLRAYTGPHTTAWPSTLLFSVQRTSSTTVCAEAAYTVTVSR